MLSPAFDRCIRNFESDVLSTTTLAKKTLSIKYRWPNITEAEQNALEKMLEFDVGYNTADKNYGPVVYFKELFKEQQAV